MLLDVGPKNLARLRRTESLVGDVQQTIGAEPEPGGQEETIDHYDTIALLIDLYHAPGARRRESGHAGAFQYIEPAGPSNAKPSTVVKPSATTVS